MVPAGANICGLAVAYWNFSYQLALQYTGSRIRFHPDRLYSRPTNFITRYHEDHQPDSRSGVALILCMLKSAPLNSCSASRRMPTIFLISPYTA